MTSPDFADLFAYLDECRALVTGQIRAMLPANPRHVGDLYELMLDYPLRYGKALRPAICIAVCRASRGALTAVLPSAAVLELYHNAFLIHDDVEDRSALRRSEDTLNRRHGAPTAVNVGDGMLALTFQPLIDNIALIGLGRSLRILRIVAHMARMTAEGQMLELNWIRDRVWAQGGADYVRMVHKKTSWYSFIAPAMVGGVAAGLGQDHVAKLGRMMIPLGIAFQIQDDILNLVSEEASYGKDLHADLWESKHTLILLHALGHASAAERAQALTILAKPQPSVLAPGAAPPAEARVVELLEVIDVLAEQGELSARARARLRAAAGGGPDEAVSGPKTPDDVRYLHDLMMRYGSVGHAARIARRYALRFGREIRLIANGWPRSPHRGFLLALAEFIIARKV